MQVDIGKYIGSLLYTNQSVSVPGLGSFVSGYESASIDPVQGELSPPSKSLMFNKNLVVDDGLLVEHICREEKISAIEAQQLLEAYVNEIKEAIDKREIVTFTDLGRLYKDYEGQIKFLPDGTNFNTNSYGLPSINFYPIGKTEPIAQAPAANDKKKQPSGAGGFFSRFLNNGLAAVVLGVATVVILVTVYFLFIQSPESGREEAHKVPTSRVNVKPGADSQQQQSTASADTEMQEESPSKPEDENPAEPEQPDEIDTERPTVSPQQKYFVIILGSFGNEGNVQRLVERIYQAGYEPYTEQSGKLTKVGIQKAYTEKSEITATLRDVRQEFSEDAKVYKQ